MKHSLAVRNPHSDTSLPEVQAYMKCLNGAANEAKAGKKFSDPNFAKAAKDEMAKDKGLYNITKIWITNFAEFIAAK